MILMAGLLSVLSLPVLQGTPASAAPNSLQIDKSVDVAKPAPGEVFTYSIQVRCSEDDCLDTQVVDELPDDLIGFPITGVTLSPNVTSVPRDVTWAPGGTSTPPATVTADTKLTVDLKQVTDDPAGVGLQAGTTYTIQISLKVPENYPPGNSGDIVNTASVSASNANTKTSAATISIESAIKMGAAVDKSWSPSSQSFNPGAESTIGLEVGNTSNVSVDSLTIQEPKNAPNGAANLDSSNPYTITDFAGFGDVALPAGCENVKVSAYVYSGGSWNWVSGTETATPTTLALPSGVSAGDVGGIRVTCAGDIEPGQKISLDLDVEQRATHRNDDSDLSTAVHKVDNVATGTAALEGQDSATDDDSASFTVNPAIPTVEAAKDITPGSITAGQSATATITGTNGGIPVKSMTVADLDFFTADVTFDGFSSAPTWPAGATAATVKYHLLGGGTEDVSFTEGNKPADPSGNISGFEITWTGNTIAADETATVKFDIATSETATGNEPDVTLTNTVDTDVESSNGLKADDSANDTLRIVDPSIEATLEKTVRPSSAVQPGETVISSLDANASATGDGAVLHDIVVEDARANGDHEFWNAFDLKSIASTQVPADTELTVEVKGTDGTWHTLTVHSPDPSTTIFKMTEAQVTSALTGLGLTRDDVVGIRFSFHNEDGFASDTSVTPNIVFEARGDLRDGGAVTPGTNQPTQYTNTATVTGEGETAGGTPLEGEDTDTGVGTIETLPGAPGPLGIEKHWVEDNVDAQSNDQASTNLDWRVSEGFSPVTISDPASGFANPADTVFDAFDLIGIKPISASNTPYSTGWYLKYDTVTDVQLFHGGSWHSVPAPGGSWMTSDRGFKGYELTGTERADTHGMRVVLQETASDTAAREAAQQDGSAFDPFAPEPDSGVGAGSTDRRFGLTWQLRDKARSDGRFVTGKATYNTASAGEVDNTTSLSGKPLTGGVEVEDVDNDTILIIDQKPAAKVAKSVNPTSDVFTPPVGTPTEDYPTATWSIVGHNNSTAKASYVRLTDPATCTDTSLGDCTSAGTAAGAVADPFDTAANYLSNTDVANPFERFDATKITIAASKSGQIDPAASKVWLLHFNGGVYTTTSHTVTAANALSASALSDVVGFSVTFQDTDPAASGGTITQDNNLTITVESRLRATVRSTGADQVLRAGQTLDVPNRVFVQSYDPVLAEGITEGTSDVDDAIVTLTGGVVNVTPTKQVSPGLITEPAPDVPVTVTLGANQGSDPRSSLSPAKVTIEDQADSAEFWNEFEFTGLGAVTLPAGADRVQVDVYDGTAWVTGTAAATAALPADVDNADVQGIRFTFTRADGALFSQTIPAPNWTGSGAFTVQLRDTYRDSGEPVTFDHSVENTQTSQSTRPDGNDSAEKDATAKIDLSLGTHEIAVHKLTNEGVRTTSAGETVPFDLTFKNVGTGYLTVDKLTDVLPAELAYNGDPAPEYTAESGGLLSEDVSLSSSPDGKTLTFNWPEDGQKMKPGETFKIRLFLELQPGLGAGQRATNTMTVQTAQELVGCRNTESGGNLTGDWAADKHTCGTTDYIGAVTGSNLYTLKGVRGSVEGAYRPGAPSAICLPTLAATGGNFYRSPCVANSQLDGTDDWVLHNVNSGTVTIDEMTIFDQLPVAGDKALVSGGSRGSEYRPQMVADSLQVTAPAGTTKVVEVTTSADVCVGTWDDLATQPVCEQSSEVWNAVDGSTDWSKVTGVRVHLDFRTSAKGHLAPGEAADVNFSTVNKAKTDSDASGASDQVPAIDQLAWNQYGVKFKYTGASVFRTIAPSKVGVHLQFGAMQLVKNITGPAKQYAPKSFKVDLVCTAGDVTLDMGDDSTVELTEGNDYSVRIDGIPLSQDGTSCVATEQGDLGEYGETSRSGSPSTVDITTPVAPGQPLPEGSLAEISNDYQYTGLSVTKKVETEAGGAEFGPFTFGVKCETAMGDDVLFDGDVTELEFTLEDGETWTAPADRIPVGASCAVTETDKFFADDIFVTGDNVVDNGAGEATVTPGVDPAAIVFTNAYDAATVTLGKVVDGAGAALYGTKPFTFAVKCEYHGQTPFEGEFEILGGSTKTLGPFPAGTSCAMKETKAAGATTTTLEPADGVVVLACETEPEPADRASATPARADRDCDVTLTATNTFDLTSFDVVKKVTGDTTVDGAKGPFEVAAVCTWLVDGQRVALDVPGGDTRKLSKANGYRAGFTELPSSTECEVTETDAKGADETTIVSEVKGKTHKVKGENITVDLSATDGPDQAVVTITNRFKSDAGVGDDGEENGILPGTGASASLWTLLAALALIGAGTAAVRRSRKA